MTDALSKKADWQWTNSSHSPSGGLICSFFVVALLAYVSQKTGNIYLKALSQFSTFLFCIYVVVYVMDLATPHFRFAHSIKNRSLRWIALAVLVAFCSYYGYRWIEVISAVIDDVVK